MARPGHRFEFSRVQHRDDGTPTDDVIYEAWAWVPGTMSYAFLGRIIKLGKKSWVGANGVVTCKPYPSREMAAICLERSGK